METHLELRLSFKLHSSNFETKHLPLLYFEINEQKTYQDSIKALFILIKNMY